METIDQSGVDQTVWDVIVIGGGHAGCEAAMPSQNEDEVPPASSMFTQLLSLASLAIHMENRP